MLNAVRDYGTGAGAPSGCAGTSRSTFLDIVRRIIDKPGAARTAADMRRLREGQTCPPIERRFVNRSIARTRRASLLNEYSPQRGFSAPMRLSERNSIGKLQRLRPRRAARDRIDQNGLLQADADPGPGHSGADERTRPRRHRPDGHRQNRGVRAADPQPPYRRQAPCAAGRGARAGAQPDARTRQPDRAELSRSLGRPLARHRRRFRRRAAGRADPGAGARPRCAGGDAGTPGRSPRRAGRQLERRRILRSRRSRPDAGSRLHQADPSRRARSAEEAAEPLLLCDHAARHPQTRRRAAARAAGSLGDPLRHDGGQRRADRRLRRCGAQARPAGRTAWRRRDDANDRVHAHQARGRSRRADARRFRGSMRSLFTATRARANANAPWRPSVQGRRAFWSPPTSPRAGSTSRTSATSSISKFRRSRRPMSTASAAPRAPAGRGRRSRSSTPASAIPCARSSG